MREGIPYVVGRSTNGGDVVANALQGGKEYRKKSSWVMILT